MHKIDWIDFGGKIFLIFVYQWNLSGVHSKGHVNIYYDNLRKKLVFAWAHDWKPGAEFSVSFTYYLSHKTLFSKNRLDTVLLS